MSYEVVSVYILLVGEVDAEPLVTVYGTADEAWRALDREVRSRCRMRARPRRRVDADAATRLANAWRDVEPGSRFWNLTVHRLPVPLPVIAARATQAAERAR